MSDSTLVAGDGGGIPVPPEDKLLPLGQEGYFNVGDNKYWQQKDGVVWHGAPSKTNPNMEDWVTVPGYAGPVEDVGEQAAGGEAIASGSGEGAASGSEEFDDFEEEEVIDAQSMAPSGPRVGETANAPFDDPGAGAASTWAAETEKDDNESHSCFGGSEFGDAASAAARVRTARANLDEDRLFRPGGAFPGAEGRGRDGQMIDAVEDEEVDMSPEDLDELGIGGGGESRSAGVSVAVSLSARNPPGRPAAADSKTTSKSTADKMGSHHGDLHDVEREDLAPDESYQSPESMNQSPSLSSRSVGRVADPNEVLSSATPVNNDLDLCLPQYVHNHKKHGARGGYLHGEHGGVMGGGTTPAMGYVYGSSSAADLYTPYGGSFTPKSAPGEAPAGQPSVRSAAFAPGEGPNSVARAGSRSRSKAAQSQTPSKQEQSGGNRQSRVGPQNASSGRGAGRLTADASMDGDALLGDDLDNRSVAVTEKDSEAAASSELDLVSSCGNEGADLNSLKVHKSAQAKRRELSPSKYKKLKAKYAADILPQVQKALIGRDGLLRADEFPQAMKQRLLENCLVRVHAVPKKRPEPKKLEDFTLGGWTKSGNSGWKEAKYYQICPDWHPDWAKNKCKNKDDECNYCHRTPLGLMREGFQLVEEIKDYKSTYHICDKRYHPVEPLLPTTTSTGDDSVGKGTGSTTQKEVNTKDPAVTPLQGGNLEQIGGERVADGMTGGDSVANMNSYTPGWGVTPALMNPQDGGNAPEAEERAPLEGGDPDPSAAKLQNWVTDVLDEKASELRMAESARSTDSANKAAAEAAKADEEGSRQEEKTTTEMKPLQTFAELAKRQITTIDHDKKYSDCILGVVTQVCHGDTCYEVENLAKQKRETKMVVQVSRLVFTDSGLKLPLVEEKRNQVDHEILDDVLDDMFPGSGETKAPGAKERLLGLDATDDPLKQATCKPIWMPLNKVSQSRPETKDLKELLKTEILSALELEEHLLKKRVAAVEQLKKNPHLAYAGSHLVKSLELTDKKKIESETEDVWLFPKADPPNRADWAAALPGWEAHLDQLELNAKEIDTFTFDKQTIQDMLKENRLQNASIALRELQNSREALTVQISMGKNEDLDELNLLDEQIREKKEQVAEDRREFEKNDRTMAICFINNRNDRLQNNLDQHRAETERRAVEDHVDMGGLNPFARKDCRPRHMWHMESCHETVRAKELKKRAAAEAARDGLKKAKTDDEADKEMRQLFGEEGDDDMFGDGARAADLGTKPRPSSRKANHSDDENRAEMSESRSAAPSAKQPLSARQQREQETLAPFGGADAFLAMIEELKKQPPTVGGPSSTEAASPLGATSSTDTEAVGTSLDEPLAETADKGASSEELGLGFANMQELVAQEDDYILDIDAMRNPSLLSPRADGDMGAAINAEKAFAPKGNGDREPEKGGA